MKNGIIPSFQYPFYATFPALTASALLALVVFLLIYLAFRERTVASIFSTILIVASSLYTPFANFTVKELLVTWQAMLLLSIAAAMVAVCCLHKKYPRVFLPLQSGIQAFVLIFFGINIFSVITSGESLIITPFPQNRYESVERPAADASKPDIFYIVLDAYGREDILQEFYGYSNHDFISFLESRDFDVVRGASSNFSQTLLSVSSALEGTPPPREVDSRITAELYGASLAKSISDSSSLKRYLKSLGYHFSAIETGYGHTEPKNSDTIAGRPFSYNYFLRSYVSTTLAQSLFGTELDDLGRRAHRNLVEYQLSMIPQLGAPDRPDFVFSHIVCPHAPFIFAEPPSGIMGSPNLADGDHRTRGNRYLKAVYRMLHAEQVHGLNQRLKITVDQILAEHGDDVWIILQGDHGPGLHLDTMSAERTVLRERFSILMAIHPPSSLEATPPADLTPINLFAFVLNSQWDSDIAYLPNYRAYSNYFMPWDFTKVDPEEVRRSE